MNKVKREIECLKRLQEMTSQLDDIMLFLRTEGLIEDNHIRIAKNSPDTAKEVQLLLHDLQKRGQLQMLEFEWTLLPVENICVHIITDRNQREFVFNG